MNLLALRNKCKYDQAFSTELANLVVRVGLRKCQLDID